MAETHRNFGPYADWMDGLGLSREHLKQLNDDYTGQASITTGRIASLMGAIKIEPAGTQNHRPDVDEIRERFKASFDYDF